MKYISIDDTIKADNGKYIINFYSFIKHELDTFDYSSKINTYDCSTILHTSGTSGSPKLCRLNKRHIPIRIRNTIVSAF